jgi:protoheme IX farnesyltransferase
MERTRRRPLPSGAITPRRALLVSFALILAGLALLAETGGVKTFVPGIVALFWYNGVYTSLKRVSAFASVPGAAVGMLPPAIGWISAGGPLFDARLAVVCSIFFMWQIPHFWLLLLNRGGEYAKAGLPSLTRVMGPAQLSRVTFIWIFAASVACLLLPLSGAVKSPLVYFALVPPGIWLVWNGRRLAGMHPALPLTPGLFKKINIYLFLIMTFLSLENIFLRMP